MSLVEIRKKFIELSGRDDLDAEQNAGADFYINAGSKALDLKGDQDRALKYFESQIADGSCRLEIPSARAIYKVWYRNSDLDWTELDPKGYDELLRDYAALENTDTDAPEVWAKEPIHKDPAHQGKSPLFSTMGIILMPPTDEDIDVKVFGKFYERDLVENNDVNYWSEEHPLLLVYAALKELETSYRNSQGRADWDLAIKEYLFDLDKDLVEAGFKHEGEMEG